MKERWFLGCKTKAQRTERERQVKTFRPAFEELTKILEKDLEDPTVRDYSCNNWALKQVAKNERHNTIKEIIKLMEVL